MDSEDKLERQTFWLQGKYANLYPNLSRDGSGFTEEGISVSASAVP